MSGCVRARAYFCTNAMRTILVAPGVAFFVSMGDLVDVGQDYDEWEAWFEASAGVLEILPIMPLK